MNRTRSTAPRCARRRLRRLRMRAAVRNPPLPRRMRMSVLVEVVERDAVIDVRQLQADLEGVELDDGFQALMAAIRPGAVGFAMIMLHLRTVLADEDIV